MSEKPGERPRETGAVPVSTNLFRLLGVAPAMGRDFTADDEAAGAAAVAMLSYSFWQDRFGGRADIVGRVIYIDGAPVTVAGVMPEGFTFPEVEDVWLPLEHTAALQQRAPSSYLAVGRLKDGVSTETARAEIQTISRALAAAYPATNRDVTARVDTHAQFFMGPDAAIIYGSLWVAGCFVLLIACANLANLTLARTLGRSRELSTRIALGAGRGG
ncbi:MAG: ABC transporter permease [Acidobacteriota bacterium]